MLESLALILAGCLLGVVTGLTPGIHVNTIALVGIATYPLLGLSPIHWALAMMAMAVTHTFLDFLPAIFLGVPEEATALSILPTHRLLLAGRSLDAVKLTAFGSILGLIFALLFIAPALILVPIAFNALRDFMPLVLAAAVILLLVRERTLRKIFFGALVFALAGWLGYTALNLASISSSQVLFPLFTGLFGASGIIYSLRTRPVIVPQEKFSKVEYTPKLAGSGFLGALGGMIVGVLPSMSPSQVGLLLAEVFGSNLEGFLVSVSAINTSDAIFSLVSLYAIGNARSGVATLVGEVVDLHLGSLLYLLGGVAFAGLVATILHLAIGRWAVKNFKKIKYERLNAAVLALITLLVYFMTGFIGLSVFAVATVVGLLPVLGGVSRTHCMGVLIVPTIIYYLGI